MICEPCSIAGDMNKAGWHEHAAAEHDACKGCECQHQTGEGWVWKPKPKA